jgi:hypothetical protein
MKFHIILRSRKEGTLYLDTYGPTKGEIEWVEDKRRAMLHDFNNVERRLAVVRQFYPRAELKPVA